MLTISSPHSKMWMYKIKNLQNTPCSMLYLLPHSWRMIWSTESALFVNNKYFGSPRLNGLLVITPMLDHHQKSIFIDLLISIYFEKVLIHDVHRFSVPYEEALSSRNAQSSESVGKDLQSFSHCLSRITYGVEYGWHSNLEFCGLLCICGVIVRDIYEPDHYVLPVSFQQWAFHTLLNLVFRSFQDVCRSMHIVFDYVVPTE